MFPIEVEYTIFDIIYKDLLNISIELYCFFNGQTAIRTIRNIITMFLLVLLIENKDETKKHTKIYFFFTLLSCIEAYNYSFVAQPFNSLSISAIDQDIVAIHPIFAVQGIVAIMILIILVFYVPKIIKKYILIETKTILISIPISIFMIMLFIASNFVFFYIHSKIIDFRGEHNQVVFDQMGNDLYRKLKHMITVKPKIISYKEPIDFENPDTSGKAKSFLDQNKLKNKLKNLIIFQLESIENQMIDPTSMTYLYNLSQKYQYFAPITSTPYSTWSSTGSILIQCGVPQIVQSVSWTMRQFDGVGYLSKMPCVPDFLKSIGYDLHYAFSGTEITQGLGVWRKAKGYKLDYKTNSDPKLFNYLNNNFFKTFKDYGRNETDKRRFVGWFLNHDTHKPYEPRSWCNPRNKKEPNWKQAADCVDQLIQPFIEKFFELKMDETTVLAVLSDHITFGNSIPQPHELFLLLPGMKKLKQKHRLPLTYYDVSHTLLDLIGVNEYEPKFIFGNSMFAQSPGIKSHPNNDDFYVLYNFYQNKLQSSSKFKGFHCFDGKQYVLSDYPCNETEMLAKTNFLK